MVVKVEVRGNSVFIQNVKKYRRTMGKQLGQGLHASALVVQNEARRLVLKGPKTGRIYRAGTSTEHQASAPGEAPASDTGTLVRNIVAEADLTKISARVIAKTAYSFFLEHGTRRMKARPFLSKALENKKRQIVAIIQASLKK